MCHPYSTGAPFSRVENSISLERVGNTASLEHCNLSVDPSPSGVTESDLQSAGAINRKEPSPTCISQHTGK